MKIKVLPPNYVSSQYAYLYLDKIEYNYKHRKAQFISNVFLSNNGLLIKNGLLRLGAAENLIGSYDKNFYLYHWKKGFEQYLVSKFGKSLKSLELNNEIYFSIHTPWFGYFSWLTSYLPRLIKVLNTNKDLKLIYPLEWNSIKYVNEMLDSFTYLNKIIIPEDTHLFIKNYYLEPVRPWTSQFLKEDLDLVRNHFLAKNETNIKPFRKIYISRSNANRRKVVNESEILDYLIENDFEIISFESLSFFEQIQLMKETKTLIGLHGAGLTNLMFMNENTNVVELTPIISDFKNLRFPFWRMASLLNISYNVIFCKIDEFKEADEYSNNVIVDLVELKKVIGLTL